MNITIFFFFFFFSFVFPNIARQCTRLYNLCDRVVGCKMGILQPVVGLRRWRQSLSIPSLWDTLIVGGSFPGPCLMPW